jgi:hypothetical protein
MKRNQIIIIIIILITTLAILTNPSSQNHKEAIKTKLTVFMQKSIANNSKATTNEWEQAGQALGAMLGGAIIEKIIENLVSTDNYILFSTTKITWEGETRIIGIGAFGNVFLTSKLETALNEGLLNQSN